MAIKNNPAPTVKIYQISEIFYSIQGEGLNSGTPAVFIRMAGCNLRCPWCDTDHRPRFFLTKKQVVSRVKSVLAAAGVQKVPLIVITGGEPMMQYDKELHESLKAASCAAKIAMETNGCYEIPPELHDLFITVSPKSIPSLRISSFRPDEIKVVLTSAIDYPKMVSNAFYADIPRFIQPCWIPENAKATEESIQRAISFTLQNPEWRLSLQTQKMARFA